MIDWNKFQAVIFDMDGVITRTAAVHAASWKKMFDEYLKKKAVSEGAKYIPFSEEDYYKYVDGKPRYEGARSFLESRGITLPYGSPDDKPNEDTVCGLGNLKNRYFLQHLKEHGVESFQSSKDFIYDMKKMQKRVAVISSSKNARAVLESAGVLDLFPVVIDGVEAGKYHLRGKPQPDIFLEAARRLRIKPHHAVVIEDAQAGVEAGKRGGFGLVIGIDRSGQNTELKSFGADIVVKDLSEIGSKINENNVVR